MEGDAFLQRRYGHSTSTYSARAEGPFAEWPQESGPFLRQNSEVGNDHLPRDIQGTRACAAQS